jgi:hypothetical protein
MVTMLESDHAMDRRAFHDSPAVIGFFCFRANPPPNLRITYPDE